MAIEAGDDFSVFAGNVHMFFGVREPFLYMREQTEACLRGQNSDVVLTALKAYGVPRFYTMGQQTADGKTILVTHFGTCVRAKLYVRHDQECGSEMDATLTFLFGDVHLSGQEKYRCHFDFGEDAEKAFAEKAFHERFLVFRVNECAPPCPPRPASWWWRWQCFRGRLARLLPNFLRTPQDNEAE